jgi:hypothetical protein
VGLGSTSGAGKRLRRIILRIGVAAGRFRLVLVLLLFVFRRDGPARRVVRKEK